MVCQDAEAVQARLSIEDKLLVESSQSWVHVPSSLILPSGGRSFEVKVLALAPLQLHFNGEGNLTTQHPGWGDSHCRC